MNEVIKDLKELEKGEPWGLQDRLNAYISKLEKEGRKEIQRTSQQNRALHLFFRLASEALNEAGWSMKKFLSQKSKVDIDWDERNFKEVIWRRVQKAVLGKESTTELRKQEDIDKVYEHVNRLLSDPPIGVHVPFPNDPERYKIEHESQKVADIEYPEYDEEKHKPKI